jgi:hypothetical protein
VFDPTAGTDGEYTGVTAGDSIPSGSFNGVTLASDGRVVFGPGDVTEVGVFDSVDTVSDKPEELALHPLINQ